MMFYEAKGYFYSHFPSGCFQNGGRKTIFEEYLQFSNKAHLTKICCIIFVLIAYKAGKSKLCCYFSYNFSISTPEEFWVEKF